MSDAERRTLREIEHRLSADAPDLAGVLASGRPRRMTCAHVLAAVFAALGVLLMVLSALGPALASFGCAALALLMRGYTWR
ncbi:DUF3040 domain-containing protein [Saccharothrix sp. NPDC042600]|uniref:DUF3040 domain-containing protein n=1 Tax=Saccharothrix TaxID=2071 RepID=UPI0033D5FF8B|nr:hypothetical protein GCM10017745_75900 [Saccharothrix mutabilis subsp. capreolus]